MGVSIKAILNDETVYAYNGSCRNFNNLRRQIASAAGWPDPFKNGDKLESHRYRDGDPLMLLFEHFDNEGKLMWQGLWGLSSRLFMIIDNIESAEFKREATEMAQAMLTCFNNETDLEFC